MVQRGDVGCLSHLVVHGVSVARLFVACLACLVFFGLDVRATRSRCLMLAY